MKVFARYFSDGEFKFRRNTLLQFGISWELIGSIVLVNPGSAKPITNIPIEGEILAKIASFTGLECSKAWVEFNPDPTMRWIEKLFRGYYYNGIEKDLNGVIQLFNLFNLRDQSLRDAVASMQKCKNEHLFSYLEDVKLFKDKPVYLGWGAAGKSKANEKQNLRETAEKIYNIVKKTTNHYLYESFDENSFYHPRYINMSYNKPRTMALLHNFHDNTNTNQPYQFTAGDKIVHRKITKQEIDEAINKIQTDETVFEGKLSFSIKPFEVKKDTIRFKFDGLDNDILALTITSIAGGYIGIRGTKAFNVKEWNDNLVRKEDYIRKLHKLKFGDGKTWLGIKSIMDMGIEFDNQDDQKSLIDQIIEEIENFRKSMFENDDQS